jgi:phosphohistidine phosphatase SixA
MFMAMKPQFILVMRHAEKPADSADPNLSAAGVARAGKLAHYIPDNFGDIDLIFAAATSKHSVRPYETVKPLSDYIGVPVDSTVAADDYAFLARELVSDARFVNKRIVVCWHHENIPSFMRALGASSGGFPDPWNPLVFDLIWEVTYGASLTTVTRMPQPF